MKSAFSFNPSSAFSWLIRSQASKVGIAPQAGLTDDLRFPLQGTRYGVGRLQDIEDVVTPLSIISTLRSSAP